jgi:hypothetical protein
MTPIITKLRRNGRRRYIEEYEFPRALRNRLVDALGSARRAEIALDGLRGWYLACLYADVRLIGMPSRAVDAAWHEMILMTREYDAFCRRAFGSFLHHRPDSTARVSMSEILIETLAVVDAHDLPMILFTADQDAGLKGGYVWKPGDLRHMRTAIERRRYERSRRRHVPGSAGFTNLHLGGYGSAGDGTGRSSASSAATAAPALTVEGAEAATVVEAAQRDGNDHVSSAGLPRRRPRRPRRPRHRRGSPTVRCASPWQIHVGRAICSARPVNALAAQRVEVIQRRCDAVHDHARPERPPGCRLSREAAGEGARERECPRPARPQAVGERA